VKKHGIGISKAKREVSSVSEHASRHLNSSSRSSPFS
jgi:hypothetical protein